MTKRRILSLILTFSIIMTSFAAAVYAAEEGQDADAPYEQAVTVLSALGIMTGKSESDFAPNDNLTRAEMSTIAVRFLGIDSDKTGEADSQFADVDAEHWGKKYINTAYALELVNGNGDGSFEPDSEVTAEQAVKILVCALGYEPKAQTRGEYPASYLSVAAELGLLRGIDFANGYSEAIPRWKVAMLVFNALDIDLMDILVYGEDNLSVVNRGTTALEVYHNAENATGVITATYSSSVSGGYANPGEAVIDGVTYKTELNAGKYLGYSVDFYYIKAQGSEKGEIIAIFPLADKADRTEVDFDDVSSINVGADFGIDAQYWDKGGDKKKSVSLNNPVIIYNGKAESFAAPTDAKAFLDAHMNQGKLVFMSNSRIGARDVLFVESYDAYVISDINPEFDWITYNIYTAEGIKQGKLDLADNGTGKRVFYYDENGNDIMMGDLSVGNVIMVYESTDKLVYNIYRSLKRVSGKLEKKEKLDGTVDLTNGDKTYETISTVDFSNITESQYKADYAFESAGETPEGVVYRADVLGNGGTTNPATSYLRISDLGDPLFGGLKGKTLPEISSGNVFRFNKEPYKNQNPIRSSMLRLRNVYDKSQVKVGDILRMTLWVYTDNIYDGDTSVRGGVAPVADQENATSSLEMYLSVETNTGANQAGYQHNAVINENERVRNKNIKNHEWTPLVLEYEVTLANKNAADLRIDQDPKDNTQYAANLFIAGLKVEKVVGGASLADKYEFPEDNNRYKLFIGEEGYEPVNSFYSSLVIGSKDVTLLLDLNNKVVGYIQAETKSGYGMVMEAAVNYSMIDGNSLNVKILESDGTTNVYQTTDKVKAWDGTRVSKLAAETLITDSPSDPMTDWHLWSTNNSSNFAGVYHGWMTDEMKSDMASRKIVYYETNTDGLINKIIVPSVPESDPDCKLVMLHNYGWHTNPWISYNDVTHVVGTRMLSYVNGTYLNKEEYMYKIDDFAAVYEALPMEYDETDYRVLKNNITDLPDSGIIDGMDWKTAQIYRYANSPTINFLVINPTRPSNGSDMHKVVIVDSIGEGVDGYTLEGYSDGLPYSMPIKENVRVMENILVTDLTADWKYVTKEMMPQLAEDGAKPYFVFFESDVMGNQNTPYVTPQSVFKGDTVRILERDGEIISLEIVRRASTGVVTMYNATYPSGGMYSAMMQWNTCVRGEIVDIDRDLNILTVKGYYTSGTNPVVNINKTPIQSGVVKEFTTLLHFTNSGGCVYETDTGKCYPATKDDYEIGDELFTWKYTSSPTDPILYKTSR